MLEERATCIAVIGLLHSPASGSKIRGVRGVGHGCRDDKAGNEREGGRLQNLRTEMGSVLTKCNTAGSAVILL